MEHLFLFDMLKWGLLFTLLIMILFEWYNNDRY